MLHCRWRIDFEEIFSIIGFIAACDDSGSVMVIVRRRLITPFLVARLYKYIASFVYISGDN